ncbi:MAG: sulfatase [Actinobacteria bacterium]|nr:sulfatase [Actinomycetota bacterium]
MILPRLIVTISCHDLGRHLGCYGAGSVNSPNLDALAHDGVRFDRAFCAAPQCSPSRAALATGRYPHSNGVMGLAHGNFGWDLHPEERHVASLLAAHGYRTNLFGLQHVTSDPARLGFDVIHGTGSGTEVSEAVARWCSSNRTPGSTYLEINLFEPHRPYDYGGVLPDDSRGVNIPGYLPEIDESRAEMAALQGAIKSTDRNIGRILNALDATGMMDEALILFTADHGIAMPRAKCTLYDPGIEIALIVRWPDGGVRPGTRSELIGNVDALPTLLESAGISAPHNLQGRSFLPLVQGRSYRPREAVYAEKTFHSYYDPMRAMRTERYKLIWNFESAFAVEVPGDVQRGAVFRSSPTRYSRDRAHAVELYDLEEDPLERDNLMDDSRYAEQLEQMGAHLHRWMSETRDPLLTGPIPSPHYRRLPSIPMSRTPPSG